MLRPICARANALPCLSCSGPPAYPAAMNARVADPGPLRDCRLALCFPTAHGARVAALRELGVPTVGLDPAAAAVAACRAAGAPAWLGSLERLASHRHVFDGIWLATALPANAVAAWAALDEALAPGGRLLAPAEAAVPAGYQPLHGPAGQGLWRKPRPASDVYPGVLVGPYADLFVGCRAVAELGAGSGRFLDALHLREVAAVGFEPDPGLRQAAERAGRRLAGSGLRELLAWPEAIDGVFLGHGIAAFAGERLTTLLATLRTRLAMNGRVLVRAPRRVIATVRAAVAPTQWRAVHASEVPGDAEDGLLLLLADATSPPTTPPAAVPDLAPSGVGSPLEAPPRGVADLDRFERRETSQGGEDGVLQELFARHGTTDRCSAEFGCGDGVQCNTAALRRRGWRTVLLDGDVAPGAPDAVIHQAWITPQNIEALLDAHGVPREPDLLSIDLDGNDYWVWRAIRRRPRIVVAEYNGNLAADRALTIAANPDHRWDGSAHYGASLPALIALARRKGYTLVHCTQAGVNAFFVRDDLLRGAAAPDPGSLFRAANYWYRGGRSLPDLDRQMVEVDGS